MTGKFNVDDAYYTALYYDSMSQKMATVGLKIANFEVRGAGYPIDMGFLAEAGQRVYWAAATLSEAAVALSKAVVKVQKAEYEATRSWVDRNIGDRLTKGRLGKVVGLIDKHAMIPGLPPRPVQFVLGGANAVEGTTKLGATFVRHPIQTPLNIGANFNWMAVTAWDAVSNPTDREKWKTAAEYWGVYDIKDQYDAAGGGQAGTSRAGGYAAANWLAGRFTPRVAGSSGRLASNALKAREARLREFATRNREATPPSPTSSFAARDAHRNALAAADRFDAQADRLSWWTRDLSATRPGQWAVSLRDDIVNRIQERAKVLRVAAEMQRAIDNYAAGRPPGNPGERSSSLPDRSDRLNLEAAALEALARGDVARALGHLNDQLGPDPVAAPAPEKRMKDEQAAEDYASLTEAARRMAERRPK